jgi:AcrR family transcriptional regulator
VSGVAGDEHPVLAPLRRYEGFTIAAVCGRAQVSVAAIYARVMSKEALFFAVYDHVLEQIRRERIAFDRIDAGGDRPLVDVVRDAVAVVVAEFAGHRPFMRAVILLSGENAEVRRRGSAWTTELGRGFARVLLRRENEFHHDDVAAAVDTCFRVVFSSVVIRVAYGATFESPRVASDEEFLASLQLVATSFLWAPRD